MTRGFRNMPGNLVRDSRVKFEQGGTSLPRGVRLKLVIAGTTIFNVLLPESDPRYIGSGFAGFADQGAALSPIGNQFVVWDNLAITGSGGYSFSDNFNRANAANLGVNWTEELTGSPNVDRFCVFQNQLQTRPVEVFALPAVNIPQSLAFPSAQPVLTDQKIVINVGNNFFNWTGALAMLLRCQSKSYVLGMKSFLCTLVADTAANIPVSSFYGLQSTFLAFITIPVPPQSGFFWAQDPPTVIIPQQLSPVTVDFNRLIEFSAIDEDIP